MKIFIDAKDSQGRMSAIWTDSDGNLWVSVTNTDKGSVSACTGTPADAQRLYEALSAHFGADEHKKRIRQLEGKLTQAQIGASFGITPSAVSGILLRKSWRNI